MSSTEETVSDTVPDNVPTSPGDGPADAGQPPTSVAGMEMIEVETKQVKPNTHQPRRHFNDAALESLAQSIKVAGVLQPIIVSRQGDHYELIAGERRWRAAKLAGFERVPAIVRPTDDGQRAQLALIENIHREDLNPIDRGRAYKAILDRQQLTHQQLADQLGEDRSIVTNHLRLLDLAPPVQELIIHGKLSLGHGKLLVALLNPQDQLRMANLSVAQQLSVRKLEELLKGELPKPQMNLSPERLVNPLSAHTADLERQISRDLQMRIQLQQAKKGGKGRLVIHYASLDQFDQLLNRLQIKIED
jgi:ParB family transcriptional regulator, chromosome partitioning protein